MSSTASEAVAAAVVDELADRRRVARQLRDAHLYGQAVGDRDRGDIGAVEPVETGDEIGGAVDHGEACRRSPVVDELANLASRRP